MGEGVSEEPNLTTIRKPGSTLLQELLKMKLSSEKVQAWE
jgi:hypothetical protein